MDNLFKRRFAELTEEVEGLEASKQNVYDGYLNTHREQIDSNKLLTWKVKAKNLLSNACDGSPHYKHFEDAQSSAYSTELEDLRRMKAVFLAAREDFEGGYLVSMRDLVQAEVFDSELEQATELLGKHYKIPAAVIAGTVLETSLRELCGRNNLTPGKLDKMNADLAKQGVFNANMAKRITTLAGIRNSAAHGKPDEFTDADVKGMIEDIERFLLQHLS